MANELVVQRTQLPTSQRKFRAAQYVRMSTDKQRYSIENQAAVIAAYAQLHDLQIVRTYSDEGESGLKLKNRLGLTKLLTDVSSEQADFGWILVYDVSRWGRFQDIDESAHYEFVCRQAGIHLVYCAEQFDNDGTMVSSIVKNIKRVMAAEYSRELSAKVFAGSCKFARMGFQLGGPALYGLRRVVVDEKRETKGVLAQGDRKFLQTDRVRLQPGDDNEIAIVRWIFRRFLELKSEKSIAFELNQCGIPAKRGALWNGPLITRILKNEKYIGNVVYNRRSGKLQTRHMCNPPEMWIRSEGSIEAIVEVDVFLSANKIMQERRVDLSEHQMLMRLRETLQKEGRLSTTIINNTVGLPCHMTYVEHFGTIRNAYKLIGYVPDRDCDHIDARKAWNEQLSRMATRVAAKVAKMGGHVSVTNPVGGMQIDETLNVYFRVARWHREDKRNQSARWRVQRRRLPDGWIVVVRLGAGNDTVLDYLLMPTARTDADAIWLTEKNLRRLKITRFEDFDVLVRSIGRRVARQVSQNRSGPNRGRSKRIAKVTSRRARVRAP